MGVIHFNKIVKNKLAEAEERLTKAGFVVSRKIFISFTSTFDNIPKKVSNSLFIDDVNKRFAIVTVNKTSKLVVTDDSFSFEIEIYDFKDLVKFEVYEDGVSVLQGKLGSSLVGALAFGEVGAIVGASGKRNIEKKTTKMQIILNINNLQKPMIVLELFDSFLETSREVSAVFSYILKQIDDNADLTPKNEINYEILNAPCDTSPLNTMKNNAVDKPNNKWTSFFLCLLLGWLGVHKFYERKTVLGIVYLLTFGLFGIGVLIDLIIIVTKK